MSAVFALVCPYHDPIPECPPFSLSFILIPSLLPNVCSVRSPVSKSRPQCLYQLRYFTYLSQSVNTPFCFSKTLIMNCWLKTIQYIIFSIIRVYVLVGSICKTVAIQNIGYKRGKISLKPLTPVHDFTSCKMKFQELSLQYNTTIHSLMVYGTATQFARNECCIIWRICMLFKNTKEH